MASEDDLTLVAGGGWCAPSETIYDLGRDRDAKPIVPDVLMKDRATRPAHGCALPDAETYTVDDWHCSTCATWWGVDRDYCYECGRSGSAQWRRSYHPLEGPSMEDGDWELVPSRPEIIYPEITTMRGGIRYGDH